MRLIHLIFASFAICVTLAQEILESVSWGSQNQNVRLYYSDSGEIKEKVRSGGSWSEGSFDYFGNNISVITYVKSGRKFRAYVSNENHIQEYIDSGSGWTTGNFYQEGEVANASYYFDTLGTLHIIVYVVNSSGEIWQYNFDEAKVGLPSKGWDSGTKLFTLP
jgi:hypothetical protein